MKTYTLHVSLAGAGRSWRKIEIAGNQTLEDLHYAIQDAFEWDADHMYSFFMSGRAWDESTEYTLPEDAMPWGFDLDEDEEDEEEWEEEWEEEEDEEEVALEDESDDAEFDLSQLSPADLTLLQQMVSKLQQAGVTVDDIERTLNILDDTTLSDAEKMRQTAPLINLMIEALPELDGAEGGPGDVRTTTLDDLNLHVGKKFLYLFDYGDEHHFNIRVHAINPNAPPGDYPRLVEARGAAPLQYPDLDDEWDEEEDE